jgi:multidrug efflux pump subunit AcrA (membrane-fusion protein)
VTVNITRETSPGLVLAVPVTALVALSSGGYAVEVIEPRNTRRWVSVQPGIFDDDNGLVQVSGNLTPGQRVVVSAS